jgi:NAD dependent epimerase/dehydratase
LSLKGKKVLVTGADGFIGSHLVEQLVRAQANVRAFVLYNSFNSRGWLDVVPADVRAELEIFAGDIRDPHGVAQATQDCDIVFHLAALIGIPYSYHSPDTYVETNVKGTLNLVQAAKAQGVKRFIHTSTSEVYGTARFVPITEEHPLQGQSPYSASKIGADHIAMSFFHSFKTPVVVVRPFNTFGPRQSARAVIPTIITQIAAGQRKIKLGSLHPTRNFNYVHDTVSGFIAAGSSSEGIGQVINFGTEAEISIRDLALLIAEEMGVQIEIECEELRMRPEGSEVDRLSADSTRARTLLHWEPLYGGGKGFRRALRETIEWFSQPCNLSTYKHEIYNV